ncbi:MAG: integrase family protein [Gammaproteobacteria bacterium]|nr:integrase family protein [Gammaproteobacteria bacterium]MCW5582614.1 integrase family protein [Gammaproteobacteria bacterium]
MHITKTSVEKLPIPPKGSLGQTGQKRYYDDKLKGFGVRVTSGGAKTFIVEKLVKGKLCRIKIGRFGELTAEQARKNAEILLGQIASGIDPLAEKHTAKMREVTLQEVMQDYLQARKSLKPKTLYDYNRVLTIAFVAWKNKPLISITKDKVAKLHEKLGKENGEAYANLAMRVLRALFNFAAGQYEDSQGKSLITENPVKRLSQNRAWYRIERRQTFIKSHELADWYTAVKNLGNETLRDYLLFILFTGLRRQEAAKLKWNQVDLKSKSFTIIDTKNRKPHTLPLSDYLFELFTNRYKNSSSDYVFPGTGEGGYIIEPRKQMAKVIESTGIQFTVHDLRRTFITIAESLDIAAYALKRLLNHKMNGDVTAGYIILDVERLRKPMQMIADHLLLQMKLEKSSVTPLYQIQEKKI